MNKKLLFMSDSRIADRTLRISADDDDIEDDTSGSPGAGSALTYEDDLERDNDLGGSEGEGGSDSGDSIAEKEEIDYKKRYSDTKEAYDTVLSRERDAVEEVERLRAQISGSDRSEEEGVELERRYGEELYSKIQSIPDDDPERAKKIYLELGKNIAGMERKIRADFRNERDQEREASGSVERNKKAAWGKADTALEEVFLDKDIQYNKSAARKMFRAEVDAITDASPEWFNYVPESEQFFAISRRVAKKALSNKEKNKQYREDGGGNISRSARINKRTSEDDDEDDGSLIGGMKKLKTSQRQYGSKLSQMVGR